MYIYYIYHLSYSARLCPCMIQKRNSKWNEYFLLDRINTEYTSINIYMTGSKNHIVHFSLLFNLYLFALALLPVLSF